MKTGLLKNDIFARLGSLFVNVVPLESHFKVEIFLLGRSLLAERWKPNTVGVFNNVLSTLGNSMYYNNYIESPRVEAALQ